MTAIKELKAVVRERAGKGAAREERRAGRVPAVIYGEKQDPITISLEHKEITRTIYAGHFLTTLFLIEVDGKKHRVIHRDYQLDPLRICRCTWTSCGCPPVRASRWKCRCTS